MGNIDRIIRVLISLVIIVLYFTNVLTGTLAIILLIISGILLLTSLFSVCPIYMPFGLSTLKKKE
jgi:hypothetical protein